MGKKKEKQQSIPTFYDPVFKGISPCCGALPRIIIEGDMIHLKCLLCSAEVTNFITGYKLMNDCERMELLWPLRRNWENLEERKGP